MTPDKAIGKPSESENRRPARRGLPAAPPAKKVAKLPTALPIETGPSGKAVRLKTKLVRDSFTMPQADFDLVAALKARALAFQRPAKKSELLRAGLQALQALDDKRLQAALEALVPLKVGRPKKAV
jgi:hypothetical protein